MDVKHEKLFILLIITWMKDHVYSCEKDWQLCGNNNFCCCHGNTANCADRHLEYIPRLPRNVTDLLFDRNKIKALTAETFENIKDLEIIKLDLSWNGILTISQDAFKELRHLQDLSLSNNYLINKTQLSMALFNNSWNLKQLNLNNCGLKNISNTFFEGLKETYLETLILQHNHMKEFNEMSFHVLPNLKTLDLSYNWIEKFVNQTPRVGHMSIKSLYLAYNEFMTWPPWFCDENKAALYPNLEILDLSRNLIVIPYWETWQCLAKLQELDLSGNALNSIHNDTFLDLASLERLDVSKMTKPMQSVQPKAFHNVNLKELNLEMNGLRFGDTSLIPYRGFLKYSPNLISLNLGANYFFGLNDSETVEMLSPLSNLKVLNLNQAHLTHIPSNLLQNFKLTELYLNYNQIQKINATVFMNITTLRYLGLGFNKITIIDNETFPGNLQKSLHSITLSYNPFSCVPCNNIWFKKWIEKMEGKIEFIGWPRFFKCDSPPEKQGTPFIDYKATYEDCKPLDPVTIILASVGTFLIIASVIGMVAYKIRWYIRYWMIKYDPRKWFSVVKDDPERQALLSAIHDAYIIYHNSDRQFVVGALSQFMETEHEYKLFIYDRQFEAGAAKVDVIVDNIYNSNHVIAVISKHFLKDPWCDFQLNVTIDRQIELKRKFLTLITLEDVDKQLLSKSWCVLFTKTPTAEWCERKNDIKRNVFERQILTNVPCETSHSRPNMLNPTVNSEFGSV